MTGYRIEATRTQWWFALLDVTPDGIAVEIWQRMPTDTRHDADHGAMTKLYCRGIVDAPLHVVADETYALLNTLPNPGTRLGD